MQCHEGTTLLVSRCKGGRASITHSVFKELHAMAYLPRFQMSASSTKLPPGFVSLNKEFQIFRTNAIQRRRFRRDQVGFLSLRSFLKIKLNVNSFGFRPTRMSSHRTTAWDSCGTRRWATGDPRHRRRGRPPALSASRRLWNIRSLHIIIVGHISHIVIMNRTLESIEFR